MIKRLTSKYSNIFYEVEIVENIEELNNDCIFITSLIDDIEEIEYSIYKDSSNLYYAVEAD